LALFYVGPEAQQGIFSRHQLPPRLVELLLLALYKAAVWRDGLIDPSGGLVQLEMDLSGQRLFQLGPKVSDPALQLALGLAPFPGENVEAADCEGSGQKDSGQISCGTGDQRDHEGPQT